MICLNCNIKNTHFESFNLKMGTLKNYQMFENWNAKLSDVVAMRTNMFNFQNWMKFRCGYENYAYFYVQFLIINAKMTFFKIQILFIEKGLFCFTCVKQAAMHKLHKHFSEISKHVSSFVRVHTFLPSLPQSYIIFSN